MDFDSPGADHDSDSLEHRPYEPKPIDLSYRVVVRAVLWVIMGSVFVAFAIWWVLT